MATHNVEIARNRVSNVVRDSADSGALEFAYVGRNNTAHTNCFSDLDTGLLDGSYLNFLFQDDGSHYVNFSSNIVFGVHGHGLPDAGMIKSVNSVFTNTIVADSTLGFLFNLVPYTQPFADSAWIRHFNGRFKPHCSSTAPPGAPLCAFASTNEAGPCQRYWWGPRRRTNACP